MNNLHSIIKKFINKLQIVLWGCISRITFAIPIAKGSWEMIRKKFFDRLEGKKMNLEKINPFQFF